MSRRPYCQAPRATCTAGRCQPGCCVCPCPQACELPTDPEPAAPLRAVVLSAAAYAAFAVALGLLVYLACSA